LRCVRKVRSSFGPGSNRGFFLRRVYFYLDRTVNHWYKRGLENKALHYARSSKASRGFPANPAGLDCRRESQGSSRATFRRCKALDGKRSRTSFESETPQISARSEVEEAGLKESGRRAGSTARQPDHRNLFGRMQWLRRPYHS
jgi:hypothetical protein